MRHPSPASTEAPPPADPAATPDPTPRRPPRRPRRWPMSPVVPVTQFRAIATKTDTRRGRQGPGRHEQRATRRWSWSRPRRTRSSRLAGRSPSGRRRAGWCSSRNAAALTKDLAKHRKRLAFLRADAVTPAVRALAWGGRSLFGVDRVTDRGRLATARPAPGRGRRRGLRSRGDVDDVRGRRHPPGPRRVPDDPGQGQGRRLPVRRRDGRDHRPHLLLGLRLGAARHQADRQRAVRCGS